MKPTVFGPETQAAPPRPLINRVTREGMARRVENWSGEFIERPIPQIEEALRGMTASCFRKVDHGFHASIPVDQDDSDVVAWAMLTELEQLREEVARLHKEATASPI